jgi:hypothetical protein
VLLTAPCWACFLWPFGGGMSPEAMGEHVADPDVKVRRTIAQSPDAGPQLMATLATDSDDLVRAYVVENPSTGADTIKRLSEDKALIVIEALSRCPKTPPERLTALAKQFHPGEAGRPFWLNLVDNPNTPSDVRLELLGKIVADQDQAKAVSPPEELAKTLAGTWRFEVAPWTRVVLSSGIAKEPSGDRARAVLQVVKADKYVLTLTENRAARLECASCPVMLGVWSGAGGKVGIELRSPPAAVGWRLEGPRPEPPSPIAWALQTMAKKDKDSAKWTVELVKDTPKPEPKKAAPAAAAAAEPAATAPAPAEPAQDEKESPTALPRKARLAAPQKG